MTIPSGSIGEKAEAFLDDAESALDNGDPETAIDLCSQALAIAPRHPGAHFVQGDAYRLLGRLEDAADSYRFAALAQPEHASSWASLSLTLFELLEMENAQRAADRAIREAPQNPEGWWVRGLLREWLGDANGAHRAFAHARWLDPVAFPFPPTLTDEEIEQIISDALRELPDALKTYLSNVAIILEDLPPAKVLSSYDPPASPVELLGFFSGHSIMEQNSADPWSQIPPTVVIYRRNIERHARHREELIRQLRMTLFHEVGHFLGLNEAELAERGLE